MADWMPELDLKANALRGLGMEFPPGQLVMIGFGREQYKT